MKKLIILMLILAAGLTAYPQSSRSSREAKSSKSKSSQVANRSSSRSGSSRQVKSSNSQNRSQATKARPSASRSAVNKSSSSRSSAPKAVNRSSSSRSNSSAVKSGSRSSGSQSAVRSGNNSSRTSRSSSTAVRSSRPQSGSSKAVKSSSSSTRTSRSAINNSANRSNQSANRSSAQNRTSRTDAKKGNNTLQSTNSRTAVPSKIKNSDRGRTQANTAVKSRDNARSDQASRASSSSSFNRSNRQGNKTYVRNDGAKFRHQNNEVFTRNRYNVDYRDVRDLRRSRDFIRVHNHYHNWYSHRHVRRVVVHNHFYRPLSLEIRRHRYPYRRPVHVDLCWTPHLHHNFVYYYPMHTNWNNHYGDYIETASSYEAMNYAGTVKRVFGKVEEVYYSPEDKTYTLYYGAPYPYHDFSVVVPRGVAKNFSWSPSWYFEDEHVWVVGLIETWEGKPEIVVHDEQQIRRY